MATRTFCMVLVILMSAADAYSFAGLVVGVLEGSTIKVVRLEKAQRIHLYGHDCPEKGQPYSEDVKPSTLGPRVRPASQG